MATTVDTLLVRIEADMSDLRRNLKRVEQQTASSQRKISQSMGKMGGAVKAALGVAAVAVIANFGKQVIGLASSVEEMQAKSSVVFGAFTQDVRSTLQAFGDEVGRSTFELEGMASSIQDTFVPMGFARGEAAKLSVELTKLAVDVASFNNASDTETMAAFQSALVGNHETVRRFGVVITEATLQQELYRMGVTQNAKDVDNATKVQARMNLILKGTTDAHGDAARTSDSFANTSKALRAALDELLVNVVTPLLPALTKMVRGLVNATNALNSFLQTIGLIEEVGMDTANAVAQIAIKEEELAQKTQELAKHQKDLTDEVYKTFEAFIDDPFGGKLVIEGRIEDTRKAIAKLKSDIEDLNTILVADSFALAQPDEAPEQDAGPSKERDKVTDALADQRFAANQVKQEMLGLSEAHLRANEAMRGLTAITQEEAEELLSLIQAEMKHQAVIDARTKAQKEAAKAEEEKKAAHQEAADVIAELTKANEHMVRELRGETHMYADISEALEGLTHLREEDRIAITKLIEEQYELEEAMKKVREEMEKTDEMTASTLAAIQSMSTGISNALADMVMSGELNLSSLQDVFQNFVRTMIAKAFELMVINKIMNAAFNLTGSAALPTASFGGKAGGGAISGPVLVGERGPELFVPSSTGVIRNNMDTQNILGGGGGPVVNQVINIDAGVSQTVRAEMMTMLPMFKSSAMEAIIDSRRRGGQVATAFGA